MICPSCQWKDTKVVDSRLMLDSNSIKRRRKCDNCQKRFTTFEKIFAEKPWVIKNDGRREEFSPEKIRQGIQKACQKRPISTDQIDKLIEHIDKILLEKYGESEVTTSTVGQMVMEALRTLDPVAYIRFASVYKTFKDIGEFVKDINS